MRGRVIGMSSVNGFGGGDQLRSCRGPANCADGTKVEVEEQ